MASVSPVRPRSASRGEFTETIDALRGCIRGRGALTRHAAGMLAGTVEALPRGGRSQVVLDLSEVDAADPAGLDDLAAVRDRLRAAGGELPLRDAPPLHT